MTIAEAIVRAIDILCLTFIIWRIGAWLRDYFFS